MRAVNEGRAAGPRQRKLAAILSADIAGFSRLMGEDETATYEALAQLRRAIDPLITTHGGRIVSTAGDGLLADFASVVDALSCAVEMQDSAAQLNEPLAAGRRLEWRIGVNLGDVIVADDGDLYGDGVNIAARLQQLAAPGGICLSQPVYDQVSNKLALDYRPLGAQRVKNIAAPISAYAIGARRPTGGMWSAVRQHAPMLAIVLALFAVDAGLIGWLLTRPGGSEGPVAAAEAAPVATLALPARMAERTSVAVLPFKNLSPDAGQDFFSDGITEYIINARGRFSNLLVAARSASFQFKGRNVSPEEAGRALGARYLVEGSVRRLGDKLRISVELSEAASGAHLWSEIYDGELKDVFTLQDEISRRIVGAAAVRLTRLEQERVERKPTANLTAYEYLLRGRADVAPNNPTWSANFEARELFQRAIDLDPNYAAAYAALGFAHFDAAVAGWAEFPDDEMARAEALAKKALALDPANTKAYLLLGDISMYRKDWARGLAQVDQALAINPSDGLCYQVRGAILQWSGQAAESVHWLDAAARIGGLNTTGFMTLGTSRYLLGQYSEAIEALERALELNPGRMHRLMVHPVLAAAYARLGKQVEAQREHSIIDRSAPFFDAERFAAQFGTDEARRDMLAGLREAGFR